ncbi:hypothetical protein F220043C3_26010 [Enterocloster asparagiformis]|uniref:SH3 domain-containing protein n=1 Tax=Enterocloster asparagiformis TaxID=333367 RepID=UPI0034AE675E
MKYCKKCGAQMKDNAKFCPSCGAAGEAGGTAGQPPQGASGQRPQGPAGQRPPKPAGQPGGASPVEKKKKSAAPFIIICLVLVAAMAGGTAYFVWSKGKDKGAAAQVADGGSDGWGSSDGDQKKQTEEEAAGTETTAAEKETPAAEGETEPETIASAVETTVSDQPRPASTEQPEGNSQTAPEAGSTAPAQVPGGNGATYQTMYVVNCSEFITLRPGDSTTSGEICKIPLGASVSYVSTAGNGFYQVVYNGQTGYALASYLSETPGSAAAGDAAYDTMYVVNCNEFITLRTSDSTSAGEICKIPLGAAVSYVSTAGNGFYKIMYNGYTGYALASYLSY